MLKQILTRPRRLDVPHDDTAEWEEPAMPAEFHIRDEASLNWYVRKFVENREYGGHCDEWREREKARVRRTEEFLIFRYGTEAIDCARKLIAAQGGHANP